MSKSIKEKWGEVNPFTNIIFPFALSLLGLWLALRFQTCSSNSKDRDKEKQYLSSFIHDLKRDSSKLDSIINIIDNNTAGLDTALEVMQQPMDDIRQIKLNYIYTMRCDWFPSKVNFTEGTLTQLKYTGGLSLIENSEVADSIAVYDVGINLCHEAATIVLDTYKETYTTEKYVYNYKDRKELQKQFNVENSNKLKLYSIDTLLKKMNDKVTLLTNDKSKIVSCYNDFAAYQASLKLYVQALRNQKRLNSNLINLINERYSIL